MFSKVRQRVLKSAGRLPNPELETPVAKRIQLLAQIHELSKSVLHDVREVIKMFDQDEGILRNTAEAYAASLRLLGSSVKASHPEYTEFLEKQAALYDEMGHLQRRLQHELGVRVATPLSAWLHSDYTRMNGEISRMYEKKNELDTITNDLAKDSKNPTLILHQDLVKREYERQLEITKFELLRLSMIKNEHAKIISQFGAAMKEYSQEVKKLFNEHDGTASKMTTPKTAKSDVN